MKSYGGIWEKIVSDDNLREAWRRVKRGHASSAAVQEFEAGLEQNLAALRGRLAAGTYVPGGYRQFRIYDPKPRMISCAPVTEDMPFLGLRIWANCWRLKRARFLLMRRTFARRVKQFDGVALDEKRFVRCAASSDGASRWFGFKGILNDLAPKGGSSSGSNRVKRGGSWNNNANNCTSFNRNNNNPSNENNNNGFRLVSTMSEQTGFHFGTSALRGRGDEHAQSRPASIASDRHAGTFLIGGTGI